MTRGSKKASTLAKVFASMTAAAALAGCSTLPTTGGMNSPLAADEQQNSQFCLTFDQAQATAASLPVGTPKADAYKAFGISGDDMMKRLNKEDINRTIYGQSQLNIPFEKRDEAQRELNKLEGRSLTCQNVHSAKKFGLTHSQVQKDGYQYTLTFIFDEKAKLFDPVTVNGAPVHEKNNRGYLSDFSPLDTAVRATRGGF